MRKLLLGLGLTYTEIKNLSDTEVTMIIATHLAFEDFESKSFKDYLKDNNND